MALDDDSQHVMVAFRSPSTLGVFSARDGTPVANVKSCGDADDVFVDAKRHRVYMSCGSGAVDVFDTEKAAYRRIARIPTVSGARTSLFVPEHGPSVSRGPRRRARHPRPSGSIA